MKPCFALLKNPNICCCYEKVPLDFCCYAKKPGLLVLFCWYNYDAFTLLNSAGDIYLVENNS